MTKTRVVMNTSLIVGAVIVAQYILLEVFNYAYEAAEQAVGELSGLNNSKLLPYLIGDLFTELLFALGFAAGVYLSLRVIRPITSSSSWRSTILRGVLATVFGTVGVFVVHLCEALLGSVRIGPYPFGYSFNASFDPSNFGFDILNAVGSLVNPLVYNLPLVVLACVCLKLWLSRAQATIPLLGDDETVATVPASPAAKPAGR